MDLTDEVKTSIDKMSYEQLLSQWRNAPIGSQMFQGESGAYFAERMKVKRNEEGDDAAVAASKSIGWD